MNEKNPLLGNPKVADAKKLNFRMPFQLAFQLNITPTELMLAMVFYNENLFVFHKVEDQFDLVEQMYKFGGVGLSKQKFDDFCISLQKKKIIIMDKNRPVYVSTPYFVALYKKHIQSVVSDIKDQHKTKPQHGVAHKERAELFRMLYKNVCNTPVPGIKVAMNLFDKAAKKAGLSKNQFYGSDDFIDGVKKAAYDNYLRLKEGKWAPEYPNFATFVNQLRWTNEYPATVNMGYQQHFVSAILPKLHHDVFKEIKAEKIKEGYTGENINSVIHK